LRGMGVSAGVGGMEEWPATAQEARLPPSAQRSVKSVTFQPNSSSATFAW
jgi:hypothetical protein